MHELQFLIIAVIILALVFDFINGFHDTANAIATSVSTRALKPRTALRISEEEERETEKRYLEQGTVVKCYWDGKHNIIDFTPGYNADGIKFQNSTVVQL